jgi:hypothetical protein
LKLFHVTPRACGRIIPVALLGMLLIAPPSTWAAERTFRFELPSQPLGASLDQFSRTTGIKVQLADGASAGIEAQPLEGDLSPAAALAQLLSSTGLTYRFAGENLVIISAATEQGSHVTGPVRVQGSEGETSGGADNVAGVVGANGSRDVTATEGRRASVGTGRPLFCHTCVLAGRKSVESGVASNEAPGGNLTGVATGDAEASRRRLDAFRQMLPGLKRLAVLFDPGFPPDKTQMKNLDQVAPSTGITLVSRPVEDANAAMAALQALGPDEADAMNSRRGNPHLQRGDEAPLLIAVAVAALNQRAILRVDTLHGLPVPEIREPVTPEFVLAGSLLITSLSFTHLNELIAIDAPLKRTLYEIDCIRGSWSVRELQRQIGSLCFERSGLSKDKEKLAARVTSNRIFPPDLLPFPCIRVPDAGIAGGPLSASISTAHPSAA